MSFLRLRLLSLCLALFAAATSSAAPWTVVIVSSERSAAYQDAADALVDELERAGVSRQEVLQLTPAELGSAGAQTPRLFVALGAEASGALARTEFKTPVLSTLLPQMSFERVLRESGRRSASAQFSALYLNQPLARQLNLIRLALPKVRRVGVLFGAESQEQERALEEATQSRGLKLVSVVLTAREPVFQGLKTILDDADLLLALPDPQIYNNSNIQNILLTSFRTRIPMLAFSPAYVRAGALLAVHSTPGQMGQQAGLLARSVVQGKALGPPQYPQDFTVTVNEHVARSLGLNLDSQALMERLKRLEKGP